jgi:hypothetical protein
VGIAHKQLFYGTGGAKKKLNKKAYGANKAEKLQQETRTNNKAEKLRN